MTFTTPRLFFVSYANVYDQIKFIDKQAQTKKNARHAFLSDKNNLGVIEERCFNRRKMYSD